MLIVPRWQRLVVSTSLVATRQQQQHFQQPVSSSTLLVSRMSSPEAGGEALAGSFTKPVVQYIFCRRDLSDEEGNAWPTGAVAAQVAHASVAAIAEGLRTQDEATKYYISPTQLPSMTKMVFGVDSLEELEKVKQAFEEKFGNDSYQCWVEQPENIPTALATLPMERTNKVSKFVQTLKVSYL